ncbi:hypothetical protein BaRGS_00010791, partial [Batillaria attramentaria]
MDQKLQLFVACCLVSVTWVAARRNPIFQFHQDKGKFHLQDHFKPEHLDTRGYVKNCGPGGGYFNVSWAPKQIDPTRQIYLYGDIVSPIDFDVGKANVSMWYMGQPMVTIAQQVKCQDALKLLPFHALEISCPIKKGQRLSGFYVFPNTERLIGYD